MYIKQVIISGFKSYRDRLEVDPFSPKHNLIVGRNGSGKSNFFDAIAFVLSDRFKNMRIEHRKKLLHESGSGENVMNAYVEIVFDNSDGRLPVDKKEVILKRTVGVKKDEFFLDGRHISKSDVTALLESAGFSRSNPYYIVMQGKVNKLCHMKDRERLDLLKEVAGTSVYEKRREESKKIMRETNARRTKIDEVITYIEKRLSELEEEKEELNKYQNLDKQRRALEYTLYDMDFRSVGERLEQIKELRVEESTKANALHQKLTKSESEIEIVDQELQSSQRMMEDMSVEIKTLEDEYTETMQMRTAAELDVSELENQFEASNESQERLRKEQRDVLVPQIEKTKKTISSDVEPKLQDAAKKLETIRKNAKDVNQKIQSYYDKIGRGKLFESEKERDVWIRKELEMLRERESEARDNLKQAQRNFENVKKDLSENAKDSVKMLKSLQALDVESGKLLELLQEKRGTRSSKIEERRTLWKKMQQFGKQKQLMSDEMQRAKRAQAKSCPRNLLDGLAAVRRVAKEKKLKGVLGPLIENFTLKSDKMLVPVESTVGNQLFNVIVEQESTAATLMKTLVREKAGRVTFMPIDVVKERRKEEPESQDAFTLLSKLNYDSRISGIMSRVFGKVLVCRNRQTALSFSKSGGWTCVTLDGEVFNSKGNMSGGYYDMGLSRMRAQERLKTATQSLKQIETEFSKIESEVSKLDQEDTTLLGEISKLEAERKHVQRQIDQVRTEVTRTSKLTKTLKESLSQTKETISSLKETLSDLSSQSNRMKSELGTKLTSNLTTDEDKELRELRKTEKNLKSTLLDAETEFERLQSTRKALQSRLEDDLERRMSEIESVLNSKQDESNEKTDLIEKRRNLERLRVEESDLQSRLKRNLEEKSTLSFRIESLREKSETIQTNLNALRENMQEHAKQMEKLLNKRNLLQEKRDNAKRKIGELGSLPDKEVKEYRSLRRRELISMLQERSKALKKYAHVNKKALAQFLSFSEQREDLINRKKQLDEGHEAIVDLIQVLDQRKDEAIMRTFNDVAKHFENVFRELVPQGYGRLVMLTKDDDEEEEDEKVDEKTNMTVSRFTGVGVNVSFSGNDSMLQLSGGQKSLVALAIIFAIQRCDPAPFYVFDEIDQALDSTHRAAVASLIQRQANAADGSIQFITSTFWPEQVEVATQFYGVALQHKVSAVHQMKKEEASRFVREIRAKESNGVALTSPQRSPMLLTK